MIDPLNNEKNKFLDPPLVSACFDGTGGRGRVLAHQGRQPVAGEARHGALALSSFRCAGAKDLSGAAP